MLKAFSRLVLISLISCGTLVRANENTEVHLGGAYERLRYAEDVMDEKGWLPGIYLGLKRIINDDFALRARIDYYNGNLSYNGSTWTGTPIIDNKTKDWVRIIELGGDYRLNDKLFFNLGLGERIWVNDLVISYTRRTSYYYVPAGVTYYFGQGFFLKAVQNFWIVGSNVSNLSSVSSSYNDVNVKQASGGGWGGELGYRASNNPQVNLEVSIYYKEWRVNKSETEPSGSTTVFEPKNKTDIMGINLGVVF